MDPCLAEKWRQLFNHGHLNLFYSNNKLLDIKRPSGLDMLDSCRRIL